MEDNNKMKRDYRLDLLRVLAILAVLAIHCFGGKGFLANYINGLCRFSVPVFVMLSAICCAPKLADITSLSAFYKPRYARVGVPLLLFSFLYMAQSVMAGDAIVNAARNFILGKPSYHLWFGFMILGVYIFMPFVSQLVAEINHMLLFVVACFAILMTFDVGYGLYCILPFVAYALIGLLIIPILDTVQKIPVRDRLLTGIACLLVYIVCGLIAGSIGKHEAYAFTSIYSLVGSMSLMVATFALLPEKTRVGFSSIIAIFSSCSFGVYLFHVIAIRGIVRVIPVLAETRFSMATVLWILVTISSFAVTFMASKISVLQIMFGFRSITEKRK